MRGINKKTVLSVKGAVFKYKKSLLALVLAVLILLMVIKFISTLSAPSEGKIINAPPAEHQKAQKETSIKTLETKYFSLTYPDSLALSENNPKSPGLIDYWSFTSSMQSTIGSTQVGISLKNLPEGGIIDESSYRSYEAQKEKYKIGPKTFGENKTILAHSYTDPGSQQTAYLTHGNYLLIVTMDATTNPSGKADTMLSDLLISLQWN